MYTIWKPAAVAALLGLAAWTTWDAAFAQNAKTPSTPNVRATGRVAAIDVAAAFNEYQRQKDLTEEMNKLRKQLDEENRARLQKIDAKQKELDMLDANDPAYVKRMRDLLAMQIEYKNWFDLKQAELSREVSVWTARIYREITQAVEQVAQREGFDLVLYQQEFPPASLDPEEMKNRIRNRTVVYTSPAADLTQAALDKLNADYRAAPAAPMLNVP